MHSALGKRLSATMAAPVVFITALLGVKAVNFVEETSLGTPHWRHSIRQR